MFTVISSYISENVPFLHSSCMEENPRELAQALHKTRPLAVPWYAEIKAQHTKIPTWERWHGPSSTVSKRNRDSITTLPVLRRVITGWYSDAFKLATHLVNSTEWCCLASTHSLHNLQCEASTTTYLTYSIHHFLCYFRGCYSREGFNNCATKKWVAVTRNAKHSTCRKLVKSSAYENLLSRKGTVSSSRGRTVP